MRRCVAVVLIATLFPAVGRAVASPVRLDDGRSPEQGPYGVLVRVDRPPLDEPAKLTAIEGLVSLDPFRANASDRGAVDTEPPRRLEPVLPQALTESLFYSQDEVLLERRPKWEEYGVGWMQNFDARSPFERALRLWWLITQACVAGVSVCLLGWKLLHGKTPARAVLVTAVLVPAELLGALVGLMLALLLCSPLFLASEDRFYDLLPFVFVPLTILFVFGMPWYLGEVDEQRPARKFCEQCGRTVPPDSHVGLECPHCGACWGYERPVELGRS